MERDWRVSKSVILRFCLHANTKQSANNFPIPSLKQRIGVGHSDDNNNDVEVNNSTSNNASRHTAILLIAIVTLLCSASDAFDW